MTALLQLAALAAACCHAGAAGSAMGRTPPPVVNHSRAGCVFRPTTAGGFPPLEPERQTSNGLTVPGALVPAGGSLSAGSAVWDRILELAGGAGGARLVFFPTNSNSFPITDGGAAVAAHTRQCVLRHLLVTHLHS